MAALSVCLRETSRLSPDYRVLPWWSWGLPENVQEPCRQVSDRRACNRIWAKSWEYGWRACSRAGGANCAL